MAVSNGLVHGDADGVTVPVVLNGVTDLVLSALDRVHLVASSAQKSCLVPKKVIDFF